MYIHLKLIHEPVPSERWQRFFHRVWPLYLDWFVSEGHGKRAELPECRNALAVHMPELLPFTTACASWPVAVTSDPAS
ncbi:MAG: hypothetical protein IPL81_10385 [Flavobacteriales bacterium]|nr:hypothetical protein [Flavobacteriales bacterium]